MIKIITGMRRCGKSYLLFEIFASYLETGGTAPDHIIKVDLEDYKNRSMRNPDNLYAFVESRIIDNGMYYILLDEVQMLDNFEDVLNGFLKMWMSMLPEVMRSFCPRILLRSFEDAVSR
jgi:predicted AAA+ superfamily ATPase